MKSSAVLVVALLLGGQACAAPRRTAEVRRLEPPPATAEPARGAENIADPDPLVMILLRPKDITPETRARIDRALHRPPRPPGEICDCAVDPPEEALIITERRSKL